MYIFLILSLLSGVIELGSIYYGIYQSLPLYVIIMLPLFYQVGNILLNLLPQKPIFSFVLAVTAISITCTNTFKFNIWLIGIQLICCSYCIQYARMQHKQSCPTWIKRVFRVGGFVLAPSMILYNAQIVILLSLIICLFLLSYSVWIQRQSNKPINEKEHCPKGISSVMIFHQLHYFVYTYITPIYVYRLTNSFIVSASLFAMTWVIYLLPQAIAEKYKTINHTRMFFICHIFLACCMLIMAISSLNNIPVLFISAWMLTGLGGGSVFCIKHLCTKYQFINMDLSENIGHFLGPLISVMICYIAHNATVALLTSISTLFVAIALIISLYITKRSIKHEQ